MLILKEHYEKLIFGLALLWLASYFVLYFLSGGKRRHQAITTDPEPFVVALYPSEHNTSMAEIETRNSHGLMPGDSIEVLGANPGSFNKTFIVREILFPDEWEEISILRHDGTEVSGQFRRHQGKLALNANLATLRVMVEVDGSELTVKGHEIDRLQGSRHLLFKPDSNTSIDEIYGDLTLGIYQRRHHERVNFPEVRWTPPKPVDDNVSYDLFTPPRIFVVNGKLSPEPPKAPEAVKAKEPFGVQVLSFDAVPYRFNMKSWAADPLLFDESTRWSTSVKIGECYKQGPKLRIVKVAEEDPAKILKILDFKVIAETDPKKGGTRYVATLKLFDYLLAKEVIITNLGPATAGQFTFKVGSTLPDAASETKDLTEKTTEFEIGGREYRILKIDPANRTFLLEKLTGNQKEKEQKLLTAPITSAPPQKQ